MLIDRLIRVRPAAVGLALLVNILSSGASAQDTASLAAGRRLAATRCGSCHAIDRNDQSPNPRSPRFRDLGAGYRLNGLRQALLDGMIVGHMDMPIVTLTKTEADDLIAYLKALQQPPARPRRSAQRPL